MPTVLVTGANRGLGLEFVQQYAADGWSVIAACRDPGQATALQATAQGARGQVKVEALEVTDHAAIDAQPRPIGMVGGKGGLEVVALVRHRLHSARRLRRP